MNSPASQPTDGARIGRYTILREIASGGMATVFLARRDDGGATRDVAIKRLHPHLATEEEFVTMFFDEARLAARIHHPNVVTTLEVDDVEGLAIVMEYIEGPTLLELAKDQSRRGAWLPRAVTSRVMLDVLAGLHAAHELRDEQGAPLHLVHRDVSPHNILVGVDGRARITDFGIAKAEVRLSSTRDGQMKGKLAYMAPELLTSDAIDRRADVFTAGIVLWELLTARRLFTGTSEARIMHALVSGEIPTARSVLPELPEAVDAVVMKALARDPAQRWASCAAFAMALSRVIAPAAHAVVAAFATRAFTAARERATSGPVSLPPPGPSDVRRVARRERDESLDATMLEPDHPDETEERPPPVSVPRAPREPAPTIREVEDEYDDADPTRAMSFELPPIPRAPAVPKVPKIPPVPRVPPPTPPVLAGAGLYDDLNEGTAAIPLEVLKAVPVDDPSPTPPPPPPAAPEAWAPSPVLLVVAGVVAVLLALAAWYVVLRQGAATE